MTPYTGFSPLARAVIIAAAICVVVMVVRAAASVIAPMLLALFIAVIATPPLLWMRHRGMPKYVAVVIILLVLTDVGSLVALITTGALEGLREDLPRYQERLLVLADEFGGWLETIGIERSREAVRDLLSPATSIRLIYATLTNASGAAATGLLVLLLVAFMLLEASVLPAKLRAAIQPTRASEERLQHLFTAINRYMMIKCLVSLATATCIWIWLRFLRIDYAAALGMAAFLLNFIPILGNVLMAIPAVLMALAQADVATAALVAVGYVIVNFVLGTIVEPRLMGRALGISSLVVLLSLLFWGWVLGPVGLFLSVPLTMSVMVALETNPRTRPIAMMLSSEIAQSEKSDARQHGEKAKPAAHSDSAPK
jgi:AI-2 transport protein TqsA